MAASRMGFLQMFEPLYRIEQTGLLDGTLSGLKLFLGTNLASCSSQAGWR